jgi:hypothetical protein
MDGKMRSNEPISLSTGVSDQVAQGGEGTNSFCAPGADHYPRRQIYRHLDYGIRTSCTATSRVMRTSHRVRPATISLTI